jgi:hypothetical protein
MLPIFRSSTRITSNRRAMTVPDIDPAGLAARYGTEAGKGEGEPRIVRHQ